MNREKLLKEIYYGISHNIYCYSEDTFMTRTKKQYEKEWNQEKEKLEIIEELLQEEKESAFKVFTLMSNLYEEKDIKFNIDLALLVDRKNGISCYVTVNETDNKNKPIYELVLNIHKKDEFDDEYENVYSKIISKETFKDRATLKNKMEEEINIFKDFIEADKQGQRFYSKYYEIEKGDN